LILSGDKIRREIDKGHILIEPYREDCLGRNSYDLHLGRHLITYKNRVLDAKTQNIVEEIIIPDDGLLLNPFVLYLGVSEEYTEIHRHVPFLEGISSVARLGINVNPSSGKGDIGHCNTWTMEINVIQPVRVYVGMPIAKLLFFQVDGDPTMDDPNRKKSKYSSRSIKPVESMMWKNKF
jgi:dCTP deaminase